MKSLVGRIVARRRRALKLLMLVLLELLGKGENGHRDGDRHLALGLVLQLLAHHVVVRHRPLCSDVGVVELRLWLRYLGLTGRKEGRE
jgi:hypothetical protein